MVVVFSPGTGPEVPGGTFAYGIRVRSVVDPAASVVVEGDVEIGRVFGLQAKLVPVGSTGRWSGQHVVSLSNWGNAPVRLRLVPSDPDQALGYLVRPEVVEVPLGGSATARVRVRTRRPQLRGQPARLPFSIVGEPDPPSPVSAGPTPASDAGRPVVDGSFTQKPILSRLVVSASALVLVAAVAGTIFAITRPAAGPTVAEFGVPPTPVLAAAVAVGPDRIRLAWTPVPNVSGYQLQQLADGSNDVEDTKGLDKAVGAHVVTGLEPATNYCFVLVSLRGDVSSPPSDKKCARTAIPTSSGPELATTPATSSPPPTSSTPQAGSDTVPASTPPTSGPSGAVSTSNTTTTGSGGAPAVFLPTQWVLAAYVFPASSGIAESTARERAKLLEQAQVQAKVLRSRDYPGMIANDSWVTYVGPFASRDEAVAACPVVEPTQLRPDCVPYQPVP